MKRCVDWDRETRPAGAKQVLAELCAVYEESFGEASLYAELPEISALADDLNNRALSYVALGRAEDAEKTWQAALEADALHAESIYNYGLHRWRNAKTTDEELVRMLRALIESDPPSWLPRYLLAQVHFERGDRDGARVELDQIGHDDAAKEEVIAAVRVAEQLAAPSRLLRTFEGHSGAVNSVCLSADGKYALSGSSDKMLKLWDVASGRCLETLEGHSESVTAVCLSADGQYALSGSRDWTMRLWDVAKKGRCLHTFEGLSGQEVSVCLSADGQYALSGSWDMQLWDVASGRCLRVFEASNNWVGSVSLSADGQRALSGSWDMQLWDVASGRCLRTFEELDAPLVCLSADGQYALSGGGAGTRRR